MPSPNLDRLCGAGVLHAEPPAADEFAGLLRSGLARLQPRCRLRFGGSKDQGLAAAPLMNTSTLVQPLWNNCTFLRDVGMSDGDYDEQFGECEGLRSASAL
jgi:hypothetical protein